MTFCVEEQQALRPTLHYSAGSDAQIPHGKYIVSARGKRVSHERKMILTGH